MFLLSVLNNLKICYKPLNVQISIKRTGYYKVFKTQSKIPLFGALNTKILTSNAIFLLIFIHYWLGTDLKGLHSLEF